jgi:hypothetical protein
MIFKRDTFFFYPSIWVASWVDSHSTRSRCAVLASVVGQKRGGTALQKNFSSWNLRYVRNALREPGDSPMARGALFSPQAGNNMADPRVRCGRPYCADATRLSTKVDAGKFKAALPHILLLVDETNDLISYQSSDATADPTQVR